MSLALPWYPGIKLVDIEKHWILKTYEYHKKNKTQTSIALGICIRTLDSRLEQYGIDDRTLKEKNDERKKDRELQLARSRGLIPAAPQPITPVNKATGDQAAKGDDVQSIADAAPEHAVSMPERAEIQKMLPKHTSISGARGRR